MLRRSVESLVGTVLLAALVPIVVFTALRDSFRFHRIMMARRSGGAKRVATQKAAFGEFQFEGAVKAYESLIDSVIAEKNACATLPK